MDNPKKNFRPNAPQRNNGKRGYRNVGFVALLVLFGLIAYAAYGQGSSLKTIDITQAVSSANRSEYGKLEVSGNEIDITKKGDTSPTLKTFRDPNASLKDEGFN